MRLKFERTIVLLLAVACASPEQQSTSSTGLRKITITSQEDVEKLRSLGLQIIVQEENYVVIRRDSSQIRQLDDAAIKTAPIQETDLVQRLVKINFTSREQLQQIVDLGIDVWEVEGDSLLARVFDSHLASLQADSVGYRVVEQYAGRKEGGK